MIWNSINIKFLRRRMGWSQADLARRLHIESKSISTWEEGLASPGPVFAQELEMLNRLAEYSCDEVSSQPLAEICLEETAEIQIDQNSVRKRFAIN